MILPDQMLVKIVLPQAKYEFSASEHFTEVILTTGWTRLNGIIYIESKIGISPKYVGT